MGAQKIKTFMAAYFLAAKVYRITEYNDYMQNLRVMHLAGANYLENEVGLHRWARAHFPSRRYDLLTTNIAENMNSLLRHARSLPIIPLVDYIRSHVQRWFYERREQAAARDAILTPAAQAIIDKQLELSRPMTVEPVSRNEFEVKHRGIVEVVHLQEKTCSCRRFDLSQLPCAHALAACRHIRLSHNSLCTHYYTTNTWMNAYAESIHPVGNDVDWLIPPEVREILSIHQGNVLLLGDEENKEFLLLERT